MLNIVRTLGTGRIPAAVLVNGIPYSTSYMHDIFLGAPRFCETPHSEKPEEIGKIISLMEKSDEKESMLKLKVYQHWLQFEARRVNEAIDEITSETIRKNVRDVVRTSTVFECYERWNITEAAKKYNITGADVLCAIVARGRCETRYRQLFDNTSKQGLYFKDVDGISVDNWMPVGNDNFILRMAVFQGTLYRPIVKLLSSRVK